MDETKTMLKNQIVIMSALQNLLSHYTAEKEMEVIENINRSDRLIEILKNRIEETKKSI